MRVYLEPPGDADPAQHARLGYAFRLFCAIYGHTPILEPSQSANKDVTIRYRTPSAAAFIADARTVWLSRGYRARDPRQPAPPPVKYLHRGIGTVLHYVPEHGLTPDWLGEIFEWVSCADEYSVKQRDRIGRPLYAATYPGRHGLDMRTPYAAVAMHALQQEICRVVPRAEPAPRPLDGAPAHLVVPTHDVDYFPVGRMRTARRLVRNAVFSCVVTCRPALGLHQAKQAIRVACGSEDDPLDRIITLADEERRMGIGATYNFLVRHGHRLDARYSLGDDGVVETMRWLQSCGMEVGLHGSYTSLDEPRGLEREMDSMRARGFHPGGGRQHWLRYTLDRLIPAVENAGMEYDTSIGWSAVTGFRAGACFAFPPYDFSRECPAGFLEIPLIAMDQALRPRHGDNGQTSHDVAQMLARSRRLGWGGVSLLWHPAAFGAGWLPSEVGEIFWRLAKDRSRCGDGWISAGEFVERARSRYVEAGLLPDEKPAMAAEAAARYFGGAAAGQNGIRGSSAQFPENALRA